MSYNWGIVDVINTYVALLVARGIDSYPWTTKDGLHVALPPRQTRAGCQHPSRPGDEDKKQKNVPRTSNRPYPKAEKGSSVVMTVFLLRDYTVLHGSLWVVNRCPESHR